MTGKIERFGTVLAVALILLSISTAYAVDTDVGGDLNVTNDLIVSGQAAFGRGALSGDTGINVSTSSADSVRGVFSSALTLDGTAYGVYGYADNTGGGLSISYGVYGASDHGWAGYFTGEKGLYASNLSIGTTTTAGPGDLIVNGGDIGVSDDPDLIHMAANDVDVHGALSIYSGSGYVNVTASSGNLDMTGDLAVIGNISLPGYDTDIMLKIGPATTNSVNVRGIVLDYFTSRQGIEWVTATSGSGYGFKIYGVNDQDLRLAKRTNTRTWTDVLTIYRDANVGIGDTTPASKLTVYGDIKAYSGSGYVNVSASGGDIAVSDDITVGDDLSVTDYVSALGGVHVGGTSDPGTDNLLVDGSINGNPATGYTSQAACWTGTSNGELKYSTEPSCIVSPFVRTTDGSILTSLFEPHTLSWSVKYVNGSMLDFSKSINLTLSEEIQGEKTFADYVAIGVRCYQNANQMELHKFPATNPLLSAVDNNFTVLSYGESITLEFGQITLPDCYYREIVLIGYGGYDTANTRNFVTRQELENLYPA